VTVTVAKAEAVAVADGVMHSRILLLLLLLFLLSSVQSTYLTYLPTFGEIATRYFRLQFSVNVPPKFPEVDLSVLC